MDKAISNIVFTRNRPLQLEAYLESLYCNMPQKLVPTYMIYKEDQFDQQYLEVFPRYCDCIVIKENDFHDDFINLLDRLNTKYVLFGTDDVIYYDSVDFGVIEKAFEKFSSDMFGFFLRLRPQTLIDESHEHTVEALNERCRQGYHLDIDSIHTHKPASTHVGHSYFRLKCQRQRIEEKE